MKSGPTSTYEKHALWEGLYKSKFYIYIPSRILRVYSKMSTYNYTSRDTPPPSV